MLFNSFFGRKNSVSSTATSCKSAKLNKKNHQPRHFALEPLESRDLLTVTMGIDDATYDEIRATYSDFDLPELKADLNVITITPEDDGSLLLSDLQAAIYAAGESDLPDLILVQTSADSNTITYTSAEDELAIDIDSSQFGSVTIIGWGPENLTLDANDQSRVVIISEPSTVNLGGLTITGGNSSSSLMDSENYGEYAGGIGSFGTLTIDNCMIIGNRASGYGGGIASSGILTIHDSLISNNTTTGTDEYSGGGGIASSGMLTIFNSEISNNKAASGAGIINSEGTLLINDSVITRNVATSEYSSGGGIVNSLGTLTISKSVISYNEAFSGGGISNLGTATITKSEIINNTASISGGIYNDYDRTLTVENSIISENSAIIGGGGISNEGFLTITGCTIERNSADCYGGGIEHAEGTAVITNSVIRGNTVTGNMVESEYSPGDPFGAGLYGWGFTLTNCLIADNAVNGEFGSGAGIYGGQGVITNCTIAGNTASTGAGIFNFDTIDVNNSIILDDIYNEYFVEGDYQMIGVLSGVNNLSTLTDWANNFVYDSTQPLFVDAAHGDYHLAVGSQAIDKGDNALAVDANGNILTTDQTGRMRIINDVVDIGAYEYTESLSDYEDIRIAYPDLKLPESEYDINIFVVDLTAGAGLADLKAAIATAGETELQDLIVVITSDDANTLTYESADDELIIDINASQKGSVTIVGWGSKNLTLDANQNCRVIKTTAASSSKMPVVNLGGLTITGGNTQGSKDNYTYGGGIFNFYGIVTISNCSFVGNTANNGGGIFNWYILSVVNSVFVENTALSGGGGGIYNSYDDSIDSSLDSFTVTNCTISGNSAVYGGGIYDSDSRLKMTNSIVSANYASQSGSNLNPLSIDTSHNNIIGGSYGLFVNAPFFDSEGNLINADTVDLHLRSDSRAVDAGDNAAASGFDADGAARIFGESVDIGAYEFQGDRDDQPLPSSSVVTTLDDSFDPNDGVLSLREAIYYTAGYKTITFADDLNGTITLSLGQLVIDHALAIDGEGRITIDADHNSRVISVEAGTSENPVALNGLTIQNGETDSNSSGGGIYNIGALAVSNCTVTGNVSSSSGGGIYNEGVLTVMNSYILRNEALEEGGGIYNTQMSESSNHAGMTILNSVISENTVTDEYSYGAGIYNYKADLTVTNCTIAGNSSSYIGGGLCNEGELALTNSIIASNYDKNGLSHLSTLDAQTSHNNLIGYYGLFVNEPVFDSQGNLTNADTMDLHLRSDSSAIGAGDNSLASGLDADGNARIYGEDVDIGAYEYQGDRNDDPIPYSNVVDTLNDSFDLNDNEWSLREAIYYAPEYVTITFASNLNGTVTLTQGELKINKTLAIDGEGRIVIDANQKSRAISVDAGSLDNPVIINGLTIQNGFTEDYDEGAGIFNSSGSLTVSNCSILDNSSYAGGGINNWDGYVTISNCVIWGNTAQYGGGICSSSGDVTVTNSIIGENTAEYYGGGIFNQDSLTITNCTIAHNFASSSKDGIYNYGRISVNNSIITDAVFNNDYGYGVGSVSGSNNLSVFTDWTSGENNVVYDPLKPLFIDEEGGDYHLSAGSQAIDMGANALAVDANNVAIAFDLDGAARIVNGIVDIGAYEYNLDSSALLTPTLNEPTFDDTILTVTWTDVPNASGYQFEYKNATDSDWTVMDVSNPSASFNYNYELGYKIRVKALGGSDDNNSAYSSTYTIDPDYSINYNRIRAKYSDFDLPESVKDINIIVVDLTAGVYLSDLKAAITTAGETTLPDLIVVLTSDDANSLRYSSSSSELNININAEQFGAVTIVSWGPENFTLNARQYSRLMTVSGSSTVVNLGGMTFTGGKSANSSSNSNYGGGILNMYATLTISDCTFTNNTSTYGGGIFSYGDSTVNIIGSEFSGNSATTDGGGIYGGDKSNVTVTDCTVSGNSAIYGAGIYNGSSVTMTVINCQILDNTASTSGGGLFNTQNSTLIVTDSVISGNKGTTRGGGFTNYYGNATFINSEFANNTGNNGGGIYNGGSSYGSTLTLYGSTISGNTSSSSGGGIYNSSDGTLTVNTSTISGNTSSTNGGGIYNSSSSNLTLTNSEISGNKAANYGGGIINYGNSLVITNSTIAGNSSRYGGGIDNNNNKPLTVTNSIISSNYSTDNLNIASPNYATNNQNLIGSYYGLFVKAPMFDSEGNLTNADTMDLHLRTYSAAIDAGDNDAASELVTDVDGKTRIYGDFVDIGAYEYQGDRYDKPIIYSSVVNTLNDSFDPDDDEWSLREAICYATEYVTITFAENLSGTIELTLGQLTIDNPLAIDGEGRIAIDAKQNSRVFAVSAGTTENPVALNGLTIQNGSSKNDGGGILNSGTLIITNSAIAGNSANYGGGIANYNTLTITNSAVTNNTTQFSGGGIENIGSLSIVNSAITDNVVQYYEYGGGVSNFEELTITNCTFAGNSISDGVNGIFNSATLTVNNSIIADGISCDDSEEITVSGSNNLSTFTAWTSGSDNQEYDPEKPLFINAARGNYRLAKDSQAIDKGNDQLANDAGLDETSTDLAHRPRFDGEAIDIGAYEFNASYALDFVGAVSKQINVYEDTNSIPDSAELLTDWDRFYLELWAADVSEFESGDSFETAVNYNPKFHQLDTAQTISTPDGVTAEITDQTIEDDGTVTVIITLTVSDSGYTAPGSNTYWGSVLFTPSMTEGSGVDDPLAEESLGVLVDGVGTETSLIAMPFDFDKDNAVEVHDFIAFASVYGNRPSSFNIDDPRYAQTRQADFDGSGIVDVQDFISFATNYGLKKGQSFNIQLPQQVNAVPGAPAQVVVNEPVIEEQTAVLTPVAMLQVEAVETVVTVQEPGCLTPAQPAQAASVQTLQQAYSSALLDLFDNQNEPDVAVELSASAIDEALYQDDEFDFLFDESDLDSDDSSNSDVDLSAVLDELELELI